MIRRDLRRRSLLTRFPMRPAMWLAMTSLMMLISCSKSEPLSNSSASDDTKSLQGTWKMTAAKYDGENVFEDVRWTFSGDQFVNRVHGTEERSQFKLGVGGPQTIWIKHHDNALAGQGFWGGTLTGIYELSGDRLRVCLELTGRRYPKSFDASKGSRQMIYELARESR